jgi:hypothetical protein
MKIYALILSPLFVSCAALSGADGSGPDPAVIGDTAGGIATAVTGNPAIGIAVGTLVGGAATWFYKRKKAPAA